MANLLVSGPAGAGKSAVARLRRREMAQPAVIADFQSIYVAVSGDVRDDNGNYPERDPDLLQLVERERQRIIRDALEAEIGIVGTNSDGAQARREYLLGLLGPGATEELVDPGIDVVSARLSDPATGSLSDSCSSAISRWYSRL